MPHWHVPEQHELEAFARADQPQRDRHRAPMLKRWNWLCTEGCLDLVKGMLTLGPVATCCRCSTLRAASPTLNSQR